ncbi:MAG: aldo/keto reductase [Leptospirillia bacterium]
MRYRKLGTSGLQVSAVSLGSWTTYGKQVGEDVAAACVAEALDAGVNLFDTAEGYADGEAERILGRVLTKLGTRRDRLVISTKVYNGGEGPNQRGLSRKHVIEGLNGSLRRLGLAYVDILFCHQADFATPVEETVRAMDTLVRQGKVLYWGTSCWPPERLAAAFRIARDLGAAPPTVEQPPYNLLQRTRVEQQLTPFCEARGLGLTCYSPLAGGLLTGKYTGGKVPENSRGGFRGAAWERRNLSGERGAARLQAIDALAALAGDLGATTAQLAIAWCLSHPYVSSVITGASRAGQISETATASALAERVTGEVKVAVERLFGGLDDGPDKVG